VADDQGRFRCRWTPTWPADRNAEHDFSVSTDQLLHPHDYLRVHRIAGGPKSGEWEWGAGRFWKQSGPYGATGFADSREAAALEAEAFYFDDYEG
jgi:hypothetical protein